MKRAKDLYKNIYKTENIMQAFNEVCKNTNFYYYNSFWMNFFNHSYHVFSSHFFSLDFFTRGEDNKPSTALIYTINLTRLNIMPFLQLYKISKIMEFGPLL